MLIEPRQLIGDTIEKLETISCYFTDEIEEHANSTDSLPVETLAAKEALQTIRILIPKLRTAQATQAANRAQLQFRECEHCE